MMVTSTGARRSALAASSPPNPAPTMTICGRSCAGEPSRRGGAAASAETRGEGASMAANPLPRSNSYGACIILTTCMHAATVATICPKRAWEDRMRTYAALALLGVLHLTTPAHAQEVTLRGVTAFAEKTTYSRGFET